MRTDRYMFREDVGRDTYTIYRRRSPCYRTRKVARFKNYEDVQTFFRRLCPTCRPEHEGGVWYIAAPERLPQ
jgi:hypothetical protein